MAQRSEKQTSLIAGDTASSTVSQVPSSNWRGWWLPGSLLVLAVLLTYSPVGWAGYIWDDKPLIAENPCIVGPLGLKEIWTTPAGSISPLTFTSFWAMHALWGATALSYHWVNVFFQAACALALWRVLRILQVPGAWLGAALWALHPLQVESVAWISEMKNTQSCLFYLLAILFYVKWLNVKKTGNASELNYALTLLFAGLAIASKFSTVVLPMVLWLCAWWIEGRWQWRHVVRLLPIFAMSIVASALTIWGHVSPGVVDGQVALSWPERVALSGDVTWFYLAKLVWPYPLMMIYPRWHIDATQLLSYLPLIALLIVLVYFWLNRQTWARPYFLALSYFLIVLFPFLGFFNQSFWIYSFVEDHLQYLAGMGPLALAGAGIAQLTNAVVSVRRELQWILGGVMLFVLGMSSWVRTWTYRDEMILWTDTLSKNPDAWGGENNLGIALMKAGRVDDAMLHFQKAVQLNPDFEGAHYNFGVALLEKGQLSEAADQLQKALVLNPRHSESSNYLGLICAQRGRLDEAMALFQQALAINPHFADAHNNLGSVFALKGQLDAAISQFQEALNEQPDFSGARNNLEKAEASARQKKKP